MLRLLHEAREQGGTTAEASHVVAGLSKILGAATVVACDAVILPDGTKNARGVASSPADAALVEQLLISEIADPSAAAHIGQVDFGATSDPSTALRRQLVSDETWYRSGYVGEIRKPARLDDSICSMRLGDRPASFVGLIALRAWGDPPFEEEDRDLLHLFHLEWTPRFDGANLAPREIEVLRLLVRGLSDKEIAARLMLSAHTVNDYCKRIYRKLGVHGRAELQAKVGHRDP